MKIWLRTTTSTMRDAAALAVKGEPHGTVIIAEEQTAGIGRQGHGWHSESGAGLYMSIILRVEAQPALTMALGLAVQRAVNDLASVATDLRWPNDVMLNERKLAGVLVQSVDHETQIAGIGLNVNQTAFPEDLKDLATSLLIETGKEHSRDDLLDRILAESLRYSALDRSEILLRFEEHSSYARGKRVIVDKKIKGITAGLDENGFLLVETEEGLETIVSGGVRPL